MLFLHPETIRKRTYSFSIGGHILLTRIPRNFCNTKRLPEQQTKERRHCRHTSPPRQNRIFGKRHYYTLFKTKEKLFAKEKRRYLRRLGIKSDSAGSTENRLEITYTQNCSSTPVERCNLSIMSISFLKVIK